MVRTGRVATNGACTDLWKKPDHTVYIDCSRHVYSVTIVKLYLAYKLQYVNASKSFRSLISRRRERRKTLAALRLQALGVVLARSYTGA